ncbi:alpha/beta hydrolase [Dehalococcoides mccartyi]|nr:alpha/beta hydrolase [Dehalococcoides mccartyi]
MPLLLNGFTDHTINTGEVEIGYSVGPDNGPTLLLLHGTTGRRDGFLTLIESLIDSYKIVVMDQRGHGYSGHTPNAYRREDYARDIRYVMEKACVEPTIVWGHSMGGGNAIALANDAPENLSVLVLEDPVAFGQVRPKKSGGGSPVAHFRAQFDLLDQKLSIEDMIPKLMEMNPEQSELSAAWKAECLLQMDMELLRSVAEETAPGLDDPAGMLANIYVPVLLVHADPDQGGVLPHEYLASIVPDSESFTVVDIPGASHSINRDHLDQLLPIVLPWLAKHA